MEDSRQYKYIGDIQVWNKKRYLRKGEVVHYKHPYWTTEKEDFFFKNVPDYPSNWELITNNKTSNMPRTKEKATLEEVTSDALALELKEKVELFETLKNSIQSETNYLIEKGKEAENLQKQIKG